MTISTVARRRIAAAGVLSLAFAVSSCARKPKEVRVSPARTTIYGLKVNFVMSAQVIDTKGQEFVGPELAWEVDNPRVASIDAKSGVLTTVAPGRAKVKVSHAGISGTASIEVVDAATIAISPLRMTVAGPPGTRGQMHADVKSSTGKPVLARPRWTSSEPKVASVDTEGVVTSVGPGRTTITATLGDIANSADLLVSLHPVAQFDATPRTLILRVGDTQLVTPAAYDESGKEIPDPAVDWSSSDPRTARVQNGSVTGLAPGTATVRATTGSRSADVSVLVN